MKLLIYEIKKLFGERFPVLLPALLLAICAVACVMTVPDRTAFSGADAASAVEAFYDAYAEDPEGLAAFEARRDAAVAERLNELRLQYGAALPNLRKHPELLYTYTFSQAIADQLLLEEFETNAQRVSEYRAGVSVILEQARTNMERMKAERGADLSDPLYQYQAYVYQTYDRVRGGAAVESSALRGWDSLFGWSYGGIFLFAALLLFAGGIFLPEKRCGMLPELRSYRRGRLPTGLAKLGLLAGGSALLTLLFSLAPFLVILFRQGYSDPSVSVQNVRALSLFPEVWTVRQYWVYTLLMRLLAGTSFGVLCGMLSLLRYESVSALALGAALFGACFACSGLEPARFPLVHALNPYSLYQIASLSDRLYVLQPGLACVSLLTAAPVFGSLLLVLSAAACIALFAGKRIRSGAGNKTVKTRLAALIAAVRGKRQRTMRPKKAKRYGGSLLRWELDKLLLARLPILLAVLLLFFAWTGVLVSRRIESEPSRSYRVWQRFLLPETEGDFNGKRGLYALLLSVYSAPDTGKDLLDAALARGEIGSEQLERYELALETVKEGSLSDDFDYASELYYSYAQMAEEGLEPRFTDSSGVEPLMTGGASWPLFAAMLLVLISAWLQERSGKDPGEYFECILRCTRNGRQKSFRAKLGAGLLITLAFFVLFYGAEFLILTLGRPMQALSAPLCSVPGFSGFPGTLRVSGYLALAYAVRLAAALLLSVFLVSVSALASGYVSAFGAALGVTLLPTLLHRAGLEAAGCASFASFFGGNEMLRFSVERQIFSGSFGVLTAYASGFCILTLLLLAAAYRKTVKGR